MNIQIDVRIQDYLSWTQQLKDLEEQIKLKEIAASLITTKIEETIKAISDMKKEECDMAHYYYYELTSNTKYKVIKKEVKDAAERIDIDNMATKNYFFREADAEMAGEKFIDLLKRSYR